MIKFERIRELWRPQGWVYVASTPELRSNRWCKIGMTTRSPERRCQELGRSPKYRIYGDSWRVHYKIQVPLHEMLERDAHKEMQSKRCGRLEIFRISQEDAARRIDRLRFQHGRRARWELLWRQLFLLGTPTAK